jgi:hypothetical protein
VSVPLYQLRDAIGKSTALDWNAPLDGFLWMGNAELD